MLVTLGLQTWVVGLMVALFLLICVVLILTVLIQRPQGGGLSGAFGSNAGSGQTAFGAKTGDALTIATIGMFIVYILAAIGLNYAVRPSVAATTETTATAPAGAPVAPAGATPTDGTPAVPVTTEGAAPPVEAPPTPAPDGGTPPSIILPQPVAPAPGSAEPAPSTPPASGTPAPATPGSTEPAPATPPTPPGN